MSERKKLYLVDGPNIAFRAHYAIRGGLTNSKGFPTSALYGFLNMLLRIVKADKPDYLVIVWDPKGGTFRNEIFPEYKGTRSETPDELKLQMPRFPEVAAAFGIRFVVVDNYEADDVIGTLAVAHKDTCDVTIVTSDKDMMQLIEADRVEILDTMKNDMRIGPKEVVERWGVGPDRIIDILALMGDSSDNIPGVPGIGQKGAAGLIADWGSMAGAFEHVDELKGRARKPMQAEGARASAELSYELATIKTDVELGLQLDDLGFTFPPPDKDAARELLSELEFHRLLDELGGEMQELAGATYRCVTDLGSLRELIDILRDADWISVDTETTGLDPMRAELVGLSFCVDDAEAWYVPVGHTGEGAERQLPRERVLLYLKSILENPAKKLIGQNLKYDVKVLARHGIDIPAVAGDTLLASFLLNSARKSHSLDGLALTWLRHKMISYADATRDTDGQFALVSLTNATTYAAEDAHVVWRLREPMHAQLEEANLYELYRDVEVPLVTSLARMEMRGIGLDAQQLREYSVELAERLVAAEALCHELAGRKFNTASPKQLREILFEELGLPVVKKTKTGPSTDASVLETLAPMHELPAAILQYRMLAKLKSTYVDPLPELVHPETGRVHTTYNQAAAATGRLASNDPNLQNIPIRTAEGRRIRAAFVPDEGYVFLSCDYSQVELRVLAHLCGGEGGFARAFAAGIDVHRATAADVFEVPLDEVTTDMRRTAKAINFGLVYGQTDFGLSRSLHISRAEAADYIDRYKLKYPEVEGYMERARTDARAAGYATTLLGRRRPVADLTSAQFNQRRAAERIAINTPVQGSAADLIKLAMLAVERTLAVSHPETRLLLQVHDELVLEVPVAQVEEVRRIVVEQMERAMTLTVPLVADSGVGTTWDEAH